MTKESCIKIETIHTVAAGMKEEAALVGRLRRRVLARGSTPKSNQPTRAGEILLRHRPVFLHVTPFTPVFAPDNELAGVRDLLIAAVGQNADSVGVVEVSKQQDGVFTPVGTCFRVPGGPARIVSSGHLLKDILASKDLVIRGFPFSSRRELRTTRVRFATGSFKLKEVLCAHPVWDLLVADLVPDPANGLPLPVEIETDPTLHDDRPDLVAVIGFPLGPSDHTDRNDLEAVVGQTRLGRKCVSPGRVRPAPLPGRPLPEDFLGSRFRIGHDASTPPGTSGSPMVSLGTRKMIAVHGDGGLRASGNIGEIAVPNGGVPLALALAEEPALAYLILGPPSPQVAPEPGRWQVRIPAWQGRHESGPPAAGSPALATIRPDTGDFRDFPYRPSLLLARDRCLPEGPVGRVGEQGHEPACVGFALATAIAVQLAQLGRSGDGTRPGSDVSQRMLYEAARDTDEFHEDENGGTSLRGGIKGFYENGVCSGAAAPYGAGEEGWSLGLDAAAEADDVTLGAYFRVSPRLLDMQLAICEAKAVVVSAHVHAGWLGTLPKGRIPHRRHRGGPKTHAFALIGYDDTGFIVQNSWGSGWGGWSGHPGLAHWSYPDWAENVIDAWVLRLAPRAPGSLDLRAAAGGTRGTPRRAAVIGHVAKTDAGRIITVGKLAPGLASLRETALFLVRKDKKFPGQSGKGAPAHVLRDGRKCRDIAFFLHDPFLEPDEPAILANALIAPFKKRNIYPFHVFHDLDGARNFMVRMAHEAGIAAARYGLTSDEITQWLNARAAVLGPALLRPLLESADEAAGPAGSVPEVLEILLSEIDRETDARRLHVIGLGFGARLARQIAAAAPVEGGTTHSVICVEPLESGPADISPGSGSARIAVLAGYAGNWTDLARHAVPSSVAAGRPPSASTFVEAALDGSLARAVLHNLQQPRAVSP